MDGLDQRLLRSRVPLSLWAFEDPGGGNALLLDGGKTAGEHRLDHRGGGHAHVECVDAGPLAGAFLSGGVEDDIYQRLSLRDRILLLEDVSGDLDKVGVERSMVPSGKHRADFRGFHAKESAYQIVGLADHLHVPVFDAVMDHLYIMAGSVGPDISGARYSSGDGFADRSSEEGTAAFRVDLGSDGVPNRFQFLVGGGVTSRHQRRT